MIIWGQKEGRKEGQTDREMVNYSMMFYKMFVYTFYRIIFTLELIYISYLVYPYFILLFIFNVTAFLEDTLYNLQGISCRNIV